MIRALRSLSPRGARSLTAPSIRASSPWAASSRLMSGSAISVDSDGNLKVPDHPIVPFIEGDGTGPDIWRATVRVLDAAVEKAYGKDRKIQWTEVLAGEKAFRETGEWLPERTLDMYKEYLVGIKGPLTTPIGGGITSLNVALRQILDLYVCLRPVRWFKGVPSPVLKPHLVDMVIFRENTEDIYAGIEFKRGTPEADKFASLLKEHFPDRYKKIRFPESSGFGVKPVSEEGTSRLVRAAIQYALDNGRKSITLVHKGNIMKFTEGAFKDYGYKIAKNEFRNETVTERETWILGNADANPGISAEENARMVEPGFDMMTPQQQNDITTEVQSVMDELYATHGNGAYKQKLVAKDAIADIALQQVLTRPGEFDVIATMNLNGDYLSDALAAQVGGIGIAPGGNVNYDTGHAIFEATHGTAPKYANLDKVNPGSLILSGELLLRHLGWREAADLVLKGMDTTIGKRQVTYDFHRLMDGDATLLKCSEFGDALISNMD